VVRTLVGQGVPTRRIAQLLYVLPASVDTRASALGVHRGRDSCERCQNPVLYAGRGRHRRFCSDACAVAASKERRRVDAVPRTCQGPGCSSDLPGGRRLYCTRECYQRSWYERAKAAGVR
jgi:hypothetical protein